MPIRSKCMVEIMLTMKGALTTEAAAAELGLTRFALEKWRHLKIGPRYYRVGNRIFYLPEDIAAFLKTREHEPEPTAA
jgi:hypothetical protein